MPRQPVHNAKKPLSSSPCIRFGSYPAGYANIARVEPEHPPQISNSCLFGTKAAILVPYLAWTRAVGGRDFTSNCKFSRKRLPSGNRRPKPLFPRFAEAPRPGIFNGDQRSLKLGLKLRVKLRLRLKTPSPLS